MYSTFEMTYSQSILAKNNEHLVENLTQGLNCLGLIGNRLRRQFKNLVKIR